MKTSAGPNLPAHILFSQQRSFKQSPHMDWILKGWRRVERYNMKYLVDIYSVHRQTQSRTRIQHCFIVPTKPRLSDTRPGAQLDSDDVWVIPDLWFIVFSIFCLFTVFMMPRLIATKLTLCLLCWSTNSLQVIFVSPPHPMQIIWDNSSHFHTKMMNFMMNHFPKINLNKPA